MSSKSPVRASSQSVQIEDARDQYADNKAIDVWEAYFIDRKQREDNYKGILVRMLREHGCSRVLDACCGNGVDSMILLDEGFEVVSVDGSEGMVEIARRAKAENATKPGYDKWIVEQGNWVTLKDDIEDLIGDGFDAIICFGNGFPHILNTHGDYREQKMALKNFYDCLKPGGILLVDHKNLDYISYGGEAPSNSLYFNNKYIKKVESSVAYKNDKPNKITFDFCVKLDDAGKTVDISFSFYPYTLAEFTKLADEAFGEATKHEVYGDFRPLGVISNPQYFVHLLQRKA